MDELKHCPFCGGEAKLYETDHGSITSAMIECKGCRATICDICRFKDYCDKKIVLQANYEKSEHNINACQYWMPLPQPPKGEK